MADVRGWYKWARCRKKWILVCRADSPVDTKPKVWSKTVWCSHQPTWPPSDNAKFETSFEIVDEGTAIGGQAIICNRCGFKSHSRGDVHNLYCGNCGYYGL